MEMVYSRALPWRRTDPLLTVDLAVWTGSVARVAWELANNSYQDDATMVPGPALLPIQL